MLSIKSSIAARPVRKHQVCVCDLRKKYETKVVEKVKENFNKLLVIGSVDFKMMYEILKDVDAVHKEKFQSMTKKEDVKTEVEVVEETNENIFLEKN